MAPLNILSVVQKQTIFGEQCYRCHKARIPAIVTEENACFIIYRLLLLLLKAQLSFSPAARFQDWNCKPAFPRESPATCLCRFHISISQEAGLCQAIVRSQAQNNCTTCAYNIRINEEYRCTRNRTILTKLHKLRVLKWNFNIRL